MKKQQLLDKIEREWGIFLESFAGLTVEQMQIPGASDEWSVKDILAHVTSWEEEALKYLPQILLGRRPPRYSVLYGGIDAFNAQVAEQTQRKSIGDVLNHLDETHLKLLDYVQTVPEDQFTTETRFRRRLRLDTYSHYPIHAEAINEWRKKAGC